MSLRGGLQALFFSHFRSNGTPECDSLQIYLVEYYKTNSMRQVNSSQGLTPFRNFESSLSKGEFTLPPGNLEEGKKLHGLSHAMANADQASSPSVLAV